MNSTMRTILFAISLFPSCALAEISVDPMFADGMVLQRDLDVMIRGSGIARDTLLRVNNFGDAWKACVSETAAEISVYTKNESEQHAPCPRH